MILTASYPSLRGRTVFITGGGSGIGAGLVEAFARQGAKVGFVDIAAAPSEALVAHLGTQVETPPLFLPCDITDIAALRRAIETVRDRLGPIGVLLNNAANDQRHATLEVTPEYWDERIAVNQRPQFFAAQAVIPQMQARGGGSIVNFGSVSWMLKQGGMAAYTMAKASIQGLTRSLARDFGRDNIRVNTLVPGWILTERQVELWLNKENDKGRREGQCLDIRLQPGHVAAMALFLAADDSGGCTAQDFIVDAGWT
ncbi:SDR family NAD(P)-dependent oxidoreductase [Ferrovibrio xuzhouensis]|uniref:SDR family NAD(P)-dependent oxidoreductase n=1 Tax=Ferrovibrio xuzhouensis TaxID=1576914 RepID=A0ABV7VGE5_9PROT